MSPFGGWGSSNVPQGCSSKVATRRRCQRSGWRVPVVVARRATATDDTRTPVLAHMSVPIEDESGAAYLGCRQRCCHQPKVQPNCKVFGTSPGCSRSEEHTSA